MVPQNVGVKLREATKQQGLKSFKEDKKKYKKKSKGTKSTIEEHSTK